jgi:hypothetical protein
VRVLDDVVLAFRLAGVAGEAAPLAEKIEAGLPSRDHLVHVRLVAGVEEEPVARRVEDAVQGEGQLDDAQVRAEVAARAGDLGDEEVADLGREQDELLRGHPADVLWRTDRGQ